MEGRTSLVVAHRLSTIQKCDRIVVMHHGELREMGSHNELLGKRGLYWRLYQLQYSDEKLHLTAEPPSLEPTTEPGLAG
jgi:ATP-binding cassette subfamily B protein